MTPQSSREHPERWLLTGLVQVLSSTPVGGVASCPKEMAMRMTAELHFIVPDILRKNYPAWERESFDDFMLAEARVTGLRTVALVGLAQLITNQSWAAARVEISLSEDLKAFARLECGVGEPGEGHLGLRLIPCFAEERLVVLRSLPARVDAIAWVFSGAHSYGPTGFYWDAEKNRGETVRRKN